MQVSCADERIAPVVARPREHDDASASLRQHRGGEIGRRGAGALHESIVRVPRFDRTERVDREHGLEVVKSHARAARSSVVEQSTPIAV
jgi:hypothetical protein